MKNKLFLFGDLHSNEENELKFLINTKEFPELKNLTKNDVIVQLGDFGFIWYDKNIIKQYKRDLGYLTKIAQKNFTLLVVPGNHENYNIINNLRVEEKWGGLVYVFETKAGNIYIAKRGEVYIINGKKIFTFSGAMSNDISDRIKTGDIGKRKYVKNIYGKTVLKKVKKSHVNYWEQELPTEAEYKKALYNLSKYNYKVDYIFTHTCPKDIIPKIIHLTKNSLVKYNDPVAEFLNKINELIYFKEWHFGHFHTNVQVKTEDGLFMCHYKKKPYEIQ